MDYLSNWVRNFLYTKESLNVMRNDYDFNTMRSDRENELNRILEKIYKKGEDSLTGKEKDFLKTF